MTTPRVCPQCGSHLPADVPDGLCPKCLLQLGFNSQPDNSLPLDDIHAQATVVRSDGPGGEQHPDLAARPASPADRGFTPPAPEALAPHFPQLEILELLGQGGMGAVYKARQPGLDRLVAVKILPPETAHDPAFAERFTREARALAKLNHPNIVAVYDFGQHDGLYYFIMEYVDGVNLRQLIRSGQCKPEEALRIVPQICEALQFAHDEGIVHRDIKPENILLDKRGRLKIADFGLARLLGQTRTDYTLTGPWQVMGTPHYMAPEQMDDPLKVDHRADIYALGVVFYEMLTGDLPRGRFAPPSQKVHVDVRLDEVVLRALEREPEKRYQRVSDVKTRVEAITSHAQPAMAPVEAGAVPDAVVAGRLLAFILLAYAAFVGLLLTAHWGYVSGADWYFKNELPNQYLKIGVNLIGAWLVFWLAWWWYLHVKQPEVHRSWSDFWTTLQRPDRRSVRLAIGAAVFLGTWVLALIPAFQAGSDALQAFVMLVPFLLGPAVFMGLVRWACGALAAESPRPGAPTIIPAGLGVTAGEPRLSRCALVGAIWAPLFLIAFFAAFEPMMQSRSYAPGEYSGPPWWQLALAFTLLPLGALAPFGTTILGAIGLAQIKRSSGKLYGLRLAQVDVLLFPLLLLGGAAAFAGFVLLRSPLRSSGIDERIFEGDLQHVLTSVIAVPIWFFPARALWRAVVGPRDAFDLGRMPLVRDESLIGNAALVVALAAMIAHAWPWHWIITPPPGPQHSATISNADVMEAKASALLLAIAIGAALFASVRNLPVTTRKVIRCLGIACTLAAGVAQVQLLLSLGEWEPGQIGQVARLIRSYSHMGLYATIALTALAGLFFVLRLFEREQAVAADHSEPGSPSPDEANRMVITRQPRSEPSLTHADAGWGPLNEAVRLQAAVPAPVDRARVLQERTADALWLVAALAAFVGAGLFVWLGITDTRQDGSVYAGVASAQLVFGAVLAIAALLLRRQRGRLPMLALLAVFGVFGPAALTFNLYGELGHVAALIPFWLGMPLALWTIGLLFRDEVRAAFEKTANSGPTPAGSGVEVVAAVREIVQPPADAMLLAGGVALLTAIGVAIWLCLKWNDVILQPNTRFGLTLMSVMHAVYALFMIGGGCLLRRLRLRVVVLLCVVLMGLFVPAVLALNVIMELPRIPEWPVGIPIWLGMPVALWAVIVLFRRDVRAAFDRQSAVPASQALSVGAVARVRWWSLARTITLLAALAGVVLTAAPWQSVEIRAPFTQGAITQWYLSPGYESGLGLAAGILFLAAFVATLATFQVQRVIVPTLTIAAGLVTVLLMFVYLYHPPLADRPEVSEVLTKIRSSNPALQVEGRAHLDVVHEARELRLLDYWQRIIPAFSVAFAMAVLVVIAATIDCALIRGMLAVELSTPLTRAHSTTGGA